MKIRGSRQRERVVMEEKEEPIRHLYAKGSYTDIHVTFYIRAAAHIFTHLGTDQERKETLDT